ncbi:GNAT family N-acetyltransferase [Scopulibacillus cellulosilyticus]|uniref:GNAT family N-acetyltransferase n=1 Tax=Scopulibacillus cellulosilyticus TaxID=2665665 RepID=A0ABW2PS58_9BACL
MDSPFVFHRLFKGEQMMVNIKKGKNKLYIEEQGEIVGFVTFKPIDDNSISVNYIFIADEYHGKGFGENLVKGLVAFAREENKKVIPACPFVKNQFNQNEQYHDVLRKK